MKKRKVVGGALITGILFLFTSRWAYKGGEGSQPGLCGILSLL